MTEVTKPGVKPVRPHFSSGPCAKPPGYDPAKLDTQVLGRSHRSKIGKQRLQYSIDLMRELLQLPDTHRIGIVPGSDTGAFEMAMWTMLGAKPVTTLAWESFGDGWVTDAAKQLKLDPTVIRADYGQLPDLGSVDWSNDVLFTWNGTTSGVRVPNGDWIPDDREGLSFADSTSAVFAYDMPWDKIDVATFSWQKVLGGEGGHGVIILGPRAVERLETYTPAWPLPKVFRLVSKGKLAEGVFKGETINTPSMLAVEDAIFALEWAKSIGGAKGLKARSNANAAALDKIVADRSWLGHLAVDEASRSKTSVCLTVEGADEGLIKKIASLLEAEHAAYDVAGYRDAPAGLRIWCGATVDTADIEALGPWLDWAYASAKVAA
ncbi:MAG: phosphoserine transaminase [Sphingobium sp.]